MMRARPAVLLTFAALAFAGCGGDEPLNESATTTQQTETAPEAEFEVQSPRDGSTVTGARRTVRGTASPGAKVTIDGDPVEVAADGTWSHRIKLSLGENEYETSATLNGGRDAGGLYALRRKRNAAERAEFERKQAAKRAAERARRAAARARRAAAREAAEANYKASAQTIPYNQLKKNADRYAGDRVKFTGQIMQIQESDYGDGMMLLSVTNEGYDIWDDNVWVNYSGSIKSAEDDVITVYGKIDGSKSYETQIGGETYVPEMTAKYIDE